MNDFYDVDLTRTDAYNIASEEFNNDIIEVVEDYFEKDCNDIDEDVRNEAARKIEETIQVVAFFDKTILERINFANKNENQ